MTEWSSCPPAAGLFAVTHAMALEHGFLEHWQKRAPWSLPWPCGNRWLTYYCCQSFAAHMDQCQRWFRFGCQRPSVERERFPELCA